MDQEHTISSITISTTELASCDQGDVWPDKIGWQEAGRIDLDTMERWTDIAMGRNSRRHWQPRASRRQAPRL